MNRYDFVGASTGRRKYLRPATPRIGENPPNISFQVAICYHFDMSQPVKLSDSLVLDARLTSKLAERSIAGQIEFWARLGRAVEPLLSGETALALRKCGDAAPISEMLASVDAPEGRRRVAEFLENQPFPHYEPAPGKPGLLVRIEEDGRRTVGRFVRGDFRPASRQTQAVRHTKKKKRPS